MKRAIWLVLSLCLGCNKSGGSDPAPNPETKPEPAPAAEAVPTDQPAADAPIKLDPGKVKAFIAYRAKYTDIQIQAMKTLREIGAKVDARNRKEHGLANGVLMLKDHVEGGEQLAANTAAARKETGLSEAEVEAFSEVAGAVMSRSSPINKQLADQVPAMEAQLAKVPAEARAEAETNIRDIKAQLAATMGMKEQRDKYGDAVVDAMLAQGPALEAEQKRLFAGMDQLDKK